MNDPAMNPDEGHVDMPSGPRLYWKRNEVGGRSYSSDEIGCGVAVWDTALVDPTTMLAAMAQELILTRIDERAAIAKAERR